MRPFISASWHHGTRALVALCIGTAQAAAQQDAHGDIPRPLAVGSQSPVTGVYGIPRAQGAGMTGAGRILWDATLELTSHFQATDGATESIILDGETARAALRARYGVSDNWTLGVEVPWVHHGGGFLDGFIIEWHDFWGFPQRGRDRAAKDEINFRYVRDGDTRIDLNSFVEGLGDIVVSAQRRLIRSSSSAAALHAQVKLPTGDADKLTGSGAVDAGAGLEIAKRWRRRWHSSFRAGLAYLGEGDVLPELQRHWAGYGGLDVVWRPARALALRVQFDAHTSPYRDSTLNELSQWSGLLTTGGTLYITRNTALDLSVVENVPNSDVVSDVTFQLRLRTNLGATR